MFTTNLLSAWKNFFMLGQFREQQEKWLQLIQSWQEFQKKTAKYLTLSYDFGSSFWKNYPNFMAKFTFPPMNMDDTVKEMNRYLRHLDSCWEEVMKSDNYAKKSSETLESFMKFQKAWEDCCEIILSHLPIASQRQLESLSEEIRKLQQKISQQ